MANQDMAYQMPRPLKHLSRHARAITRQSHADITHPSPASRSMSTPYAYSTDASASIMSTSFPESSWALRERRESRMAQGMNGITIVQPEPSSTFPERREARMSESINGVVKVNTKSKCDLFKQNLFLFLTILSVGAGVGVGMVLRKMNLSPATMQLINFPGELFMQIVRMMILPLTITSIVSSLAQMSSGNAGVIGMITVAYYTTTAVIASTIGIAYVTILKPGVVLLKKSALKRALATGDIEPIDTFLDLLRNMFSDNIFKATFSNVLTQYDRKNGTDFEKNVVERPGTNILGIVVFCTMLGIVISRKGEKVRVVTDFFVGLYEIVMGFYDYIQTVMWFAPVGIISLIAGNMLDVVYLKGTFQTLTMYVATVLLGLFTHVLIVNPILYLFVTHKSPLKVYRTMMAPFLIALGTGSSGASLPTAIECLEEHGVESRIAHFVPTFGNTLNVDGNALYEAVAVIFIAQLNNIQLSLVKIIVISVIATVGSIGQGPLPSGMVSMAVILNSVGLPDKDLALLLSVDWLCDRVRTSINVVGDGFAACIIEDIVKKRKIALGLLKKMSARSRSKSVEDGNRISLHPTSSREEI